jgi:hypothetical protein
VGVRHEQKAQAEAQGGGHERRSCPRCGKPTEIREHVEITAKHLAQPWYYERHFYCVNPACKTKQIMPDRYRVFNEEAEQLAASDLPPETAQRMVQIAEQLAMPFADDRPPWE